MPKFRVSGWVSVKASMTLDAEDEDDAIAKAEDLWNGPDSDITTEPAAECPDWDEASEIG